MAEKREENSGPVRRLHPLVVLVMAGSLVWMVFAAWFFVLSRDSGVDLMAVSGLVGMALVLPGTLFMIWRRSRAKVHDEPPPPRPLGEWTRGELETWQGRLKGRDAAILAVLPLAAVAIGMTAFVVVMRLAESNAY